MSKTIIQKVVFKSAPPKDVFNLYMNSKQHAVIINGNAEITEKEGENFSFHDGYITGKNLHILKNKLVVQCWRANDWDKNDIDSTFIICLESEAEDTILHMTHANVPDKHAEALSSGWNEFYWRPWKKFLAGKFK